MPRGKNSLNIIYFGVADHVAGPADPEDFGVRGIQCGAKVGLQ